MDHPRHLQDIRPVGTVKNFIKAGEESLAATSLAAKPEAALIVNRGARISRAWA
jgi:hypothetical protein